MSIASLRRVYQGMPLDEASADADPFTQFQAWFAAARESETDPTAMALATADIEGRPSLRMVLLKGLDVRGFVFFTNYDSRKGRELDQNPQASLLFFWAALNRQVRVDGLVERIDSTESDTYFASRPAESRLAALASPQSQVLESRAVLDERFANLLDRFPDASMPRPPFWGGYRVIPSGFEFWQGRPNRLHDRLQYSRQSNDSWQRTRLAP